MIEKKTLKCSLFRFIGAKRKTMKRGAGGQIDLHIITYEWGYAPPHNYLIILLNHFLKSTFF